MYIRLLRIDFAQMLYLYFSIGIALSYAVISGAYSLVSGIIGLLAAYYFLSKTRWVKNEDSTFSNIVAPDHANLEFDFLNVSKEEITIRGSIQTITINRRTKTVYSNKHALCTFDRIKSIHINEVTEIDREGEPIYYISLTTGASKSICIGAAYDAINASMVAAKLSRLIGKDVVA